MIQKVSNQDKVSWLENERSFDRNSMNKIAMDSFSVVIATDAKKMISAGTDVSVVAQKYHLSKETIESLISELEASEKAQVKIACACDDNKAQRASEKTAYEQYLTEAEAARVSLHNLRQDNTEGLTNSSSKRILSNKGDYISDVGGPRKQMGYESANTIFDPNRIEQLTGQKDNGERIREENAQEALRREHMKEVSRYETINLERLAEAMDNGELRRDGVHNMSATEASGYTKRVQSNGISIFDKAEFERVPEKTSGETRREELKKLKEAPKDRSWVQRGASSVKSADFLDRMIQSMVEQDPELNKIVSDNKE